MEKNESIVLTEGLQEGFAGKTEIQPSERGGFSIKVSHIVDAEGNIYHDEWSAERAGGGQELIEVDSKQFTRVYAGGTIPLDKLEELGTTKKEVIKYLKKQITENGSKTRLYSDFDPEPEGDWRYSYKIIDSEEKIPLTTGKESIYFKEKLVFVHDFIISPVD